MDWYCGWGKYGYVTEWNVGWLTWSKSERISWIIVWYIIFAAPSLWPAHILAMAMQFAIGWSTVLGSACEK